MQAMRPAAIVPLFALALAGCATINNDRTTVRGETLTAIDESVAREYTQAEGPSVLGPNRDNWEETTVVVAVDTTQHHPNLTNGGPDFTDATPRQRGEYPTAFSALSLGADTDAQVAEAFAGPFFAAWDVVMAIPRLIAQGGEVQTSPRRWYERAPANAETLAPALEPATTPVPVGATP